MIPHIIMDYNMFHSLRNQAPSCNYLAIQWKCLTVIWCVFHCFMASSHKALYMPSILQPIHAAMLGSPYKAYLTQYSPYVAIYGGVPQLTFANLHLLHFYDNQ